MLLPIQDLRSMLRRIVASKAKQGHETAGLNSEVDALPDGYDAIATFEKRLRDLPMRADWKSDWRPRPHTPLRPTAN